MRLTSRPISSAMLLAATLLVSWPLGPARAGETQAQDDDEAGRALDEAERAVDDLRYEQASALLERALRSGKNGPAALARLYALQGEVAATLGDAAGAQLAFARWLAIEPDASLTRGTSPKIVGPFDAASARLAGAALHVDMHVASDGSTVALEVIEDPVAQVAGARASYRGRDEVAGVLTGTSHTRIELPMPGADRHPITVAAIDGHGNRLVERTLTIDPDAHAETPAPAPPPPPLRPVAPPPRPNPIAAGAPAPSVHKSARSLLLNSWLWGGLALGLGAAGGYYGILATRAQSELGALNATSARHNFAEASAVEDRLRTDSLLANVSFVLAGSCAVAAVVLWLRPAPVESKRRISWQLGRDQARVALEWSW